MPSAHVVCLFLVCVCSLVRGVLGGPESCVLGELWDEGTSQCYQDCWQPGVLYWDVNLGTCQTCKWCEEYSEACSAVADGVCTLCPQFSFFKESTQTCEYCTYCEGIQGRGVLEACTPTTDTVCTECVAGSEYWDSVQCVPCLVVGCPAEGYVSTSGCGPFSDRVCTACVDACEPGVTYARFCSQYVLQCDPCATCDGAGDSVLVSCAGMQDTVCASTCAEGEYWNNALDGCAPCTITECAASEWLLAPCGADHDGVCGDCHLANCPAGQWIESCTMDPSSGVFTAVCTDCRECLEVNEELETQPCGVRTDTVCWHCDALHMPCNLAEYVHVNCSWAERREAVCEWCTLCPYVGLFDATPCGGTFANSDCRECSFCATEQYVSGYCDLLKDTQCSPCQPCADGFFALGCEHGDRFAWEGTALGAPGACEACTAEACASGTYESRACGGVNDSLCSPCTLCEANEYEVTACSALQNRECRACTTCLADVQFEAAGCAWNANRGCQNCTVCVAGAEYTSAACNATSNAVCRECTQGPCAEGTWQAVACGGGSDLVCSVCNVCGPREFETVACEGEHNRTCEACTECAAGVQFAARACSAYTDAVCADCGACAVGTEYAASACNGSNNVTCAACSCGVEEYATGGCTDGVAGYDCKACQVCVDDYYTVRPCQSANASDVGENTVCAYCGRCRWTNSYAVVGCTATAPPVCEACSSCAVGQFISSFCNETHDTVCTNCSCGPDEHMRDVGDGVAGGCIFDEDYECLPCSTCLEGEYEEVGCREVSVHLLFLFLVRGCMHVNLRARSAVCRAPMCSIESATFVGSLVLRGSIWIPTARQPPTEPAPLAHIVG